VRREAAAVTDHVSVAATVFLFLKTDVSSVSQAEYSPFVRILVQKGFCIFCKLTVDLL
jgi:hypothetical protein